MSIHVLTGQAAPAVPNAGEHLPTNRPRTYPSDTTDAEWQILAPLVPVGGTRPGVGGRPVSYPRRDIVDRYLVRTGCQWDALPVDFPPAALVKHYFTAWTGDGTLNRLHNTLREQVRQVEGRNADPTAALVDSQTVRGAETVPRASRGYDAGKLVDYAATMLGLTVHIVSKLAGQVGFGVLPRRWRVERTFSWINRCRRTVRDYERLPAHHAAIVYWPMIIIMGRRLARHQATRPVIPQPARAP